MRRIADTAKHTCPHDEWVHGRSRNRLKCSRCKTTRATVDVPRDKWPKGAQDRLNHINAIEQIRAHPRDEINRLLSVAFDMRDRAKSPSDKLQWLDTVWEAYKNGVR